MVIRNQIEYVLTGDYALFTDPLMKLGGEKMTMQIPTYSALKGITESIYWKPSFTWVIDEVRIMHPIRMESKGVRPIDMKGGNTLANYSYLRDVKYKVRAHFIFNEFRPDLVSDFNEHKHHNIAKRAVDKGGRRDIFLGARECQGYVEACNFADEKGFYDEIDEMHFGTMLHGINYPDETGKNILETRLWQPIMRYGVIKFIEPKDCTLVRPIRDMEMKQFELGTSVRSVANELSELEGGE